MGSGGFLSDPWSALLIIGVFVASTWAAVRNGRPPWPLALLSTTALAVGLMLGFVAFVAGEPVLLVWVVPALVVAVASGLLYFMVAPREPAPDQRP